MAHKRYARKWLGLDLHLKTTWVYRFCWWFVVFWPAYSIVDHLQHQDGLVCRERGSVKDSDFQDVNKWFGWVHLRKCGLCRILFKFWSNYNRPYSRSGLRSKLPRSSSTICAFCFSIWPSDYYIWLRLNLSNQLSQLRRLQSNQYYPSPIESPPSDSNRKTQYRFHSGVLNRSPRRSSSAYPFLAKLDLYIPTHAWDDSFYSSTAIGRKPTRWMDPGTENDGTDHPLVDINCTNLMEQAAKSYHKLFGDWLGRP